MTPLSSRDWQRLTALLKCSCRIWDPDSFQLFGCCIILTNFPLSITDVLNNVRSKNENCSGGLQKKVTYFWKHTLLHTDEWSLLHCQNNQYCAVCMLLVLQSWTGWHIDQDTCRYMSPVFWLEASLWLSYPRHIERSQHRNSPNENGGHVHLSLTL